MKKLFKSIALALATVTCFAFASCAKKDEVKVLKDILLTEEDYAFAIAKENGYKVAEFKKYDIMIVKKIPDIFKVAKQLDKEK